MHLNSLITLVLLTTTVSGCAARAPAAARERGPFGLAVSRLTTDDTLRVALASGEPAAGGVANVSAGGLFHEGAQTGQPPPRRSRGARIAKGAAIGFAAGVALGLAPWSREACLNAPLWHCAAKGGVTGAAVGVVIGAAKK